jgi:formylglycine-generating enzyme required for sulfatase activity
VFLAKKAPRLVSVEALIDAVWGTSSFERRNDHPISQLVSRLKKRVKELKQLIKAESSAYRLDASVSRTSEPFSHGASAAARAAPELHESELRPPETPGAPPELLSTPLPPNSSADPAGGGYSDGSPPPASLSALEEGLPESYVIPGIGIEMQPIPAGCFGMGSVDEAEREQDEIPHPVRLTKLYYLARNPVTVGQFRCFVKDRMFHTEADWGEASVGRRRGRDATRK